MNRAQRAAHHLTQIRVRPPQQYHRLCIQSLYFLCALVIIVKKKQSIKDSHLWGKNSCSAREPGLVSFLLYVKIHCSKWNRQCLRFFVSQSVMPEPKTWCVVGITSEFSEINRSLKESISILTVRNTLWQGKTITIQLIQEIMTPILPKETYDA